MLVVLNAFYSWGLFELYLPAVPICGNADFDADEEEEEGEPEETAPPEEWSGIIGFSVLFYLFVFWDMC